MLDAIIDGYNTCYQIVEKTKLGIGTVNQILNEFIHRQLLSSKYITDEINTSIKYSINDEKYIIYIEKRGASYHFISVDPFGECFDTFRFPIEYMYLNPSYSLKHILNITKFNKKFKNCLGIFLSDINLDGVQILHDDVNVINTHQMILDHYTNDNEINFIEYYDKKNLIIYSRNHETNATYEDICKVLKVDNHVVFNESEKYDHIFECLQSICLKTLRNQIFKIRKRYKSK